MSARPASGPIVVIGASIAGLVSALLCARTGPTEPPSRTQNGTPAALASASQAAMSSPDTAIMDMPP